MRKAYRAGSIRELEAPYIEDPAYDGYLMQRAAYALYSQIARILEGIRGAGVLLLVGPGNNGGDTLYAGAHLVQAGHRVEALLLADRAHAGGLEAYRQAGGKIIETLPQRINYDAVIDGILGTGARGRLRGRARDTVARLKNCPAETRGKVIACDIPSGINGDTGQVCEPVLAADATITFIAEKTPHLSPAEHLCGEITVVPLGIESDLEKYQPAIFRLDDRELADFFPRPKAADHKYTRGVLGLVTGSEEYPGAGLLSTRAAVNTGCGMVRFCGTPALNAHIQLSTPEAVCSVGQLDTLHIQAWAAGSGATGLQREQEIQQVIQAPIASVLDAEAVGILARWIGLNSPVAGAELGAYKILTPHAGELARFFERVSDFNPQLFSRFSDQPLPDRAAIEAEPFSWVQVATQLTGATVMLKGASSLIASPTGQVFSVRGENPWLATAGSGDTLTGILGSLLAQVIGYHGSPPPARLKAEIFAQTAACAVRLHNLAALVAGGGIPGPVPASRVADYLSQAVQQLLAA